MVASIHGPPHPWTAIFLDGRYGVKSWSSSYLFCSCQKTGCYFILTFFQRHERFLGLKNFGVAAEQKPYVWQSNKKCLSLYVDIPSMTLQVCLVKRAHDIDFVDASHALDINLHNIRLFYHEVLLHFSIKAPHKLDGFNIDKQGN